jgi:GAF domain-containing protein
MLVERVENGRRMLVMPVQVRGEVIGAMEFELDSDGQLSAEDRQLIEEVSQRFGIAAENARLFSESQRIAQREALINEVGARLQATSNVENTLTEAARSLQHMLKAGRVSIRLGEPPVTNGNGKDGRHD